MSIKTFESPNYIVPPISLRELAILLIKEHGIHEGHYELTVEFLFSAGPIGPDSTALVPGVMIGFSKVGLTRSTATNSPSSVDAALVNPAKAAKTQKKRSRETKSNP